MNKNLSENGWNVSPYLKKVWVLVDPWNRKSNDTQNLIEFISFFTCKRWWMLLIKFINQFQSLISFQRCQTRDIHSLKIPVFIIFDCWWKTNLGKQVKPIFINLNFSRTTRSRQSSIIIVSLYSGELRVTLLIICHLF